MQYKTLDSLCKVASGGTPSRSKKEYWDGGDIPWIKIGNIKSKVVSNADEYITEAGLNNSSAKLFKKGTILYTIFATLGEVGILDFDACTNQAIAGISIEKPEEITTDYLYYYLKSKKAEVNQIGRGVAQNNINLSILRKFSIPLRDIEDQKTIVGSLNKVESIIEKQKRQLERLDELIKARFVEMFGDKNFETRPFKDVCDELFAGGDIKKDRTVKEADSDHPYAVFTNGEKDGGLYGYTDIARVIKPSITISGRGIIGFCLVRTEPFYPAIRLIVATPKENLVTPSYLKYFIDSKDYNGRGASIPQLTIPMIKDEPVPIPPIELQNQFETFIAQVDKSKFALSNELAMGYFYVRLIHDRIVHGRVDL